MTTALYAAERNGHSEAIELALVGGDLGKLNPDHRLIYYKQVCESVGLNPLTKPFDYIVLNNRLTLYATKNCAEQLRAIHGVSVSMKAREVVEDCYVVTATARTASREDESIGAVSIAGLKGEARANAMMKAETKAKRRVTLSICGLGMLDETEVESIPGAYREDMTAEANSLTPREQLAARQANPQPPRKVYCSQNQIDAIRDIMDEIGLAGADRLPATYGFEVKRPTSLSPEQADELLLKMCRRRVAQLLTELALNLDDVRIEAPAVAADTPDELDQDQANAALAVLRHAKQTAEGK